MFPILYSHLSMQKARGEIHATIKNIMTTERKTFFPEECQIEFFGRVELLKIQFSFIIEHSPEGGNYFY